MTTLPLRFPPPLAAAIARLPVLPPSFVFTRMLNLALRRSLARGDLLPLADKRIAIRVGDLGLRLHFTLKSNRFVPVRTIGQPDLAITASAHDFYLLASRQEDPDALFFSRRLVVEGDTELGLFAKNALDGLDLPEQIRTLLSAKWRPGRLPSAPAPHARV